MKKSKKATAGERIAGKLETYGIGPVVRGRFADRIDRDRASVEWKERKRCLQIVYERMKNPNTSHAACADLDAVWRLIALGPTP
jgi:hypothetical protein